MKNLILLFLFWGFSSLLFAQSVTIMPGNTVSEGGTEENLVIRSNSAFIGLLTQRYNGSLSSKTAVLTGDALLNLQGGGYFTPTSFTFERARIQFRASQNWSSGNNGTRINFSTTPNGSTTLTEKMVIDHNGNIGIGNTSPTAKLHINHHASASSPTLHLQSNGTVSSIIRATSTVAGSEWNNHFVNGSVPGTNLVYWVTGAGATPLILTGEGDAIIENKAIINGFTKLGNEISSPSIKMKEITGTTANSSGGYVDVVHGLVQSKIIAVSIFVTDTYGSDIPPGLTMGAAKYEYFIITNHIRLHNILGSDTQIINRPFRMLITYKE